MRAPVFSLGALGWRFQVCPLVCVLGTLGVKFSYVGLHSSQWSLVLGNKLGTLFSTELLLLEKHTESWPGWVLSDVPGTLVNRSHMS